MWVRQCHCGRIDVREHWDSAEAADDAGVYFAPWQCQECGGAEFELVEFNDSGRVKPSDPPFDATESETP